MPAEAAFWISPSMKDPRDLRAQFLAGRRFSGFRLGSTDAPLGMVPGSMLEPAKVGLL